MLLSYYNWRIKMKKVGSRGFSLIELLAVVVILGVLSGVGISAYSRIVTK